ncbi:GNAT family N-acetyltransferase [Sporosarcina highlanderae]|uniref:GNAT family N-acetyltransferase n=1 Tax=Sporosarcina highlanderae TaxID=3035916 RepID=A0ABT8JL99_9BACL|nr:GNAT family N-acetyltransferase [Sporosarcina highlanderae]MDN4605928.1 GNAT family N-acetyltransferase [Sporosarcina highlanderae]
MGIIINRLRIEEFNLVKNKLIDLQHENVQLSFPDKKVNPDYVNQRIDSIYTFIKEDKAIVFIAKDEDTVIGFIWCYPRVFYDEHRIFINSLIVSKEYRSKNVGKDLVESVECYTRDSGYAAIDVSAAAFNTGALRFYRNNGFIDERVQLVKPIGDI